MNDLPTEITTIILNLLDFKSQISFIFVSEINKRLLKYWIIKEIIYVNKKILEWYHYDYLENIVINKLLDVYPKKLQYLTFGTYFNQTVDNLPSSIKSIKFGEKFNQSVDKLPSGARSYWRNPFLQKRIFQLPSGARSIRQNLVFPENEIRRKPSSIKNIKFGINFNQPVDKLPSSIKNIEFGWDFNQSVDKLPSSIENIKFGSDFNQTVDNLPSGALCYWRNPFFTKTDFPITFIN